MSTTIQTNNKKIVFKPDVLREFVRGDMFGPYVSTSPSAIIRTLSELKKGGEQINIPIVKRLTGTAKGSGTLTGNEEAISNYGCRMWVDYARHAVAITDAEDNKDAGMIFDEARSLLTDHSKELQRDETIQAFMSLPSESAPSGLGSADGQRVNGILYEDATATQLNTWAVDNQDRILYGNTVGNYSGVHVTDLAKIDVTNDKFLASSVSLLKRRANLARPNIRPYMTQDGYSYYVCFAGSINFRDLKADLKTSNTDGRPRSKDNIIFKDGDLEWDGVIIREVPEIDTFVDDIWDSGIVGNLKTGGDSSSRVAPVFFCGQSALAKPWAKMPIPTKLDQTDYQYKKGVGYMMAYGIGKVFQKDASDNLVQFGMINGFFSAAADA